MLGSTPRVGPTTPALLSPHPLPATHLPPSPSWPAGLRRRRLEGHDAIAPPARPARPERAPAAAAASTRPRERSRGSWSSYWSLPSSGARSELRLILLPNECARGSQQCNEWASSARTQPQRSERFTVGSGEAAHLFRRLRARTLYEDVVGEAWPCRPTRRSSLSWGLNPCSDLLAWSFVARPRVWGVPQNSEPFGAPSGASASSNLEPKPSGAPGVNGVNPLLQGALGGPSPRDQMTDLGMAH